MTTFTDEVKSYNKYDILYDYEIKFNEYISDMFYEGLDTFDYEEIKDILIRIKHLKAMEKEQVYLERIETLYNDYHKIYESIKKNVIPMTLRDVLNETASLLHLVYTNNKSEKIKLYATASVMFSCQFHNEKTPSFGVTDSKGLSYCFGCGKSVNVVDYIMEYEILTYQEAVQLLSRIYMINLDFNMMDENDPLVQKYRKTLLSDAFNELLKKLNDRIIKREQIYNATYSSRTAKDKIINNYETIERIKRGEYEKFYNNKNKQKKLVLIMPEFSNFTNVNSN